MLKNVIKGFGMLLILGLVWAMNGLLKFWEWLENTFGAGDDDD